MFEACAGVRRGAMTAHFANAERAHDGGTVRGASPDDFNIGGTTAK